MPNSPGTQLITHGVIQGFVPNNPDVAIVTNGIHQVYAYIVGNRALVGIGKTYQVYKSGNLYCLGQEVKAQ
jgi:hypothetical protein